MTAETLRLQPVSLALDRSIHTMAKVAVRSADVPGNTMSEVLARWAQIGMQEEFRTLGSAGVTLIEQEAQRLNQLAEELEESARLL